MSSRLASLLASPRIAIVAVGVAVVLNLPSVPTGWYLDDLVHRAQFLEVGPRPELTDASNMTDRMFDFLSGDPDDVLAFKDLGVLPWWSEDRLEIRFWRPLSSFTHVVDYTLWPNSGTLMHAHSVAWLAALIAAIALLYRRMIPVPVVAGLATLLYALDDAHGMPTAFLANRNALIATFFGVLSLWLHDRFRRDDWKPGMVLSPLAFSLTLLAGESGIGIAPYLLGYALFLERDTIVRRLTTIAPHALVGMVWLAYYKLAGYGTHGSGFYLDPVSQPAEWLSHVWVRAPLLLLGQWFVPPSSFAFAWNETETLGVAAFGVCVLAVISFLLRPIVRDDPTARFFAFGMLLAVVPITAGFPHDRLLFFVGIGAMPLLAMLLVRLFDRTVTRWPGRVLGYVLVLVHLVFAPLFQLVMSTVVATQEPIYADAPRSLPNDPALENQRLVIVNAPSAFYGQYALLVRAFDKTSTPASLLMLAPGTTTLVLERPEKNVLTIEAQDGWLGSPFDNVYRSLAAPFPENYQVELSDVRIDVESLTEDGRPKRARFTFQTALDDPTLRWVVYSEGSYVPFEVPEVGQRRTLEKLEFNLLSPPPPGNPPS